MRGEDDLSTTYSDMSESTGKCRNRYVDHLKGGSKLACLIHGPGHSSDECKVLGNLGTKYSKIRPTKDRRHEPATTKTCNRQKEKNAIVQRAVDEIILH